MVTCRHIPRRKEKMKKMHICATCVILLVANAFAVRLADAAGKVVAERRVVAPTADDSVVVYHRDAILSRI